MKKYITNGLLVSILLILLISFFLVLLNIVAITKITTLDATTFNALVDAGFYNAVKLILIGYSIYLTMYTIWDRIATKHNQFRPEVDISALARADKYSDDINRQARELDTSKSIQSQIIMIFQKSIENITDEECLIITDLALSEVDSTEGYLAYPAIGDAFRMADNVLKHYNEEEIYNAILYPLTRRVVHYLKRRDA